MFTNILRVEGPVYRIGSKIWCLLVLNVLIVLTSLPIVTIGASLTAAYTVTTKMIQTDETKVITYFFESFRSNFKKSLFLWLPLLVISLILGIDWLYLVQTNQVKSLMTIGVVAFSLFAIQCLQVIFFYLSRYEIELKEMVKNTVLIGLQQPFKSLLLLIVGLSPYTITLLSPYLFVFNIYISLFIGISFNLFLRTFILLMMFNRYDKKD
ncbi:MAG: DUF624 domain-containing protein [Vagococcus sp.]|uniref:YesL family protein n=1 Tax=Vagococcus TaxID=2737 RepID=UPI002FCA5385